MKIHNFDKPKEFEIDGIITTPEGVTDEHVANAIIELVESKGWSFGGKIDEHIVDEVCTNYHLILKDNIWRVFQMHNKPDDKEFRKTDDLDGYLKLKIEYDQSVKKAIDSAVIVENQDYVIKLLSRKCECSCHSNGCMHINDCCDNGLIYPSKGMYQIPDGYRVEVEDSDTVEDGGGCYVAGTEKRAKLIKI